MTRSEALEEYVHAQRRAQREYREKIAAGQYPYLPVLDDILEKANVENQLPIGLVEVPMELLVGTKTAGRTAAFAANFMPLLGANTEFASKWVSLCQAHVEEGIRDPIRCFEYMGRFYVQEGNKRVSVLKYFQADSITANVTRVMPKYSDSPEVRLYYEFVEYYPLCGMYTLTFTQEGSFARLQKALGKAPGEKWTEDDRAEILSLYNWVKKAYFARGGASMRPTPGDVLLLTKPLGIGTLSTAKKVDMLSPEGEALMYRLMTTLNKAARDHGAPPLLFAPKLRDIKLLVKLYRVLIRHAGHMVADGLLLAETCDDRLIHARQAPGIL